jgi:hypothetical protein
MPRIKKATNDDSRPQQTRGEFFMPITIGSKPAADFSNPIELLSDCHRRIKRFLAVLVSVARQAHDEPMTEKQREEWLRALDYFRNAAPRHTADEEESLFPRLRQIEQLGRLAYGRGVETGRCRTPDGSAEPAH